MYVEIVKLSINSKDKNCFISIDIFNKLDLTEDTCYILHVGKLTSNIYPMPYESTENTIYINDKLMEELCIYENMSLNIWKESNHIFLGPVVGVLVAKEDFKLVESGTIQAAMKGLFKANEKSHCLLYYFSNESFYINNKKVYGYTLLGSTGQLNKLALPLADTIYEQINSASQGESMIFQYMRKLLTHYFDIQYINNHMYLGKWEIYKCLLAMADLTPYLPKTMPFDEFEDIKIFIDFFGKAILKPSYKSTRGALLIEKQPNMYHLYYNLEDKLLSVKDISELKKIIADYTKEELFILQQSFSNIRAQDENLYVLLGKNSKGKWIVIDSPKCLQKGSLELLFLKIGNCIEKQFGHFGEIELLVILDSYGRPWITDVNIPPNDLNYYSNTYHNDCKLRYLSILEYSKFLANKDFGNSI